MESVRRCGWMVPVVLLTVALQAAGAGAAPGEVELGLAAGYPGDSGLEKDESVIFFTGYDDESWKTGWTCSNWDCYSLTSDPEIVFSGKSSLQKHGPGGNNGASLTYDLEQPVDVLYHRVYGRFRTGSANTRFIGLSGVAAGMPQWKAMGSAGVRPTQLPYFCATLTTQDDNPLAPMWYPYHIDQKGNWGDNWPIDVRFPADRWFCLEMMVKMNTPGNRNGELRLWVDGRPVYAKTDMRWRLDPTVQIGRAFDQVYRSKPFPRDSYYWVDNRVIATRYIGPMLPEGSEPVEIPRTAGASKPQSNETQMVERFRADFEDGAVQGWGENARVAKPGYGDSHAALAVVDGREPVGLWGLNVPVKEATTVGFAYKTENMASLQLMLWAETAKDNFRFTLTGTEGRWVELTLSGSDFFAIGKEQSLVGDVVAGMTFVSDDKQTEGQNLWVDNIVIAEAPAARGEGAEPARGKATPVRGAPMPENKPNEGEIYLFVDPERRSDEDREQHNEYGLSVAAPWKDGGKLFLNFPEHLEYNPQGMSILRHWDRNPALWNISPDGRQASYRVESPHETGVVVEAFARVANPEETPEGTKGVYLAVRITNNGERTLPTVRALLCFQYRGLTGFPQWIDNFKHSFLVFDGELKAIADLPTEKPDTKFKGCVVKGCPQRDTRAERQGGLIEQDMDLALSVVESLDGTRKAVFWWTPGKSMITNASIPCIHADPYFGTLEPGQSAFAEGLALFTEGDLQPIVEELKARDRTAF